ncbi:MAG: TonB-dependent receptor, partial [Cyanobacteria bacterium P01_F01_bin.143]
MNYFNLYREQGGFSYNQRNRQSGNYDSHNFKGGADFFLNKKNTLGFIVSGSLGDNLWRNNSRMPISAIGATTPDRILIAESINEGDRNNLNFNVNYQFDNGKEVTWNIDADFGRFR